MKRFTLLLLLITAVFPLAFLPDSANLSAQSSQEPGRLFDPVGAEKSVAAVAEREPDRMAVVREQEIRVNFGAADFAGAQELSLPLFGPSYTAVRSESEGFVASPGGGLVWRGKINGTGGWSGDVTLSFKGGALSGLVYAPEAVYEIIPQKDFGHILVQLDQSLFPPCGGALPPGAAPEAAATDEAAASAEAKSSGAVVAPAAVDDGSVIDVLVVYTDDVRAALGGTPQAEAFAQQSVSVTNTAYINSDIHTRLRLAGTLEVSYADNGGDLISALNFVNFDATVNAARNSARADLVAFLVERGGVCGVGRLMSRSRLGSGFSATSYSVTARACAVGNLTFPHELGHNQGCEHNPENAEPPEFASYPYAYGHYVSGSYRTIMSYVNQCVPTTSCPKAPHFSNPSINYNGVPTGIAGQRDNARVINNTAAIIARFRESVVGPPPPNDNFADAAALGGAAGVFTGTNNGATREPDEPSFAFLRGGASVWFNWRAPSNGSTTLTTAGSSFNTQLAVYTGGGLGGLTFVAHNDDAPGDFAAGTSSITFNATAGTTYRIAVDGYGGTTGSLRLVWSQAGSAPPAVQLSSAAFGVNESARKVLINVTRAGDTTSAASIDYATADGTAGRRGDYTQALGTLSFAPGETSKAVTVFITDDVLQEGPEDFTFALSNAAGALPGAPASAVVTIDSDDSAAAPVPNPVGEAGFDADFYVRQHYVDFLNREVDAQGLGFWTNEIVSCGADAACAAVKRINVSAAFFLSIEFQETGFLAHRAHKAAFGDLPGKPVPITLRSFLADQRRLANMVIVGAPGWPEQLEANKVAYFNEFVRRPAFFAVNPLSLTAEQYVDGLFNRAGVIPTQDERALAIALFGGGGTPERAAALRSVAESQSVKRAETNRAFVLMQYFGYLRRDPDETDFRGDPDPQFNGYNFWLGKLDEFGGNFINAEMVKAFLDSIEYKQRFGQ